MKLLLATLALATVTLAPAVSNALDDGVYPVADDGVSVTMSDGSDATVAAEPIDVDETMVFSTSNDNSAFMISWKLPAHPPTPWPVIVLDGVGYRPNVGGRSGDGTGSISLETTDADLAEAMAAGFGVPVTTRTQLGEALERTFSGPSAPLVVGDPIPIELTLDAGAAIAIETGGRSRSMEGPSRDNRFTFDVRRDGEPVAGMHGAQNFGGLGSVLDLTAGGTHTATADLQDWFPEPLPPGRYTVEVRFELTLFAPGVDRGWDASGHTWADEAVGEITFEIVDD